MKTESTDYGLQELLALAVDDMQREKLRDWYFRWTRLEVMEDTLPPNSSAMAEQMAELSLRSGFGGHLRDSGAVTHTVEHFSKESVHSFQCRVVLPPSVVSSANSGVESVQRILSSQLRRR